MKSFLLLPIPCMNERDFGVPSHTNNAVAIDHYYYSFMLLLVIKLWAKLCVASVLRDGRERIEFEEIFPTGER